MRTFHVLNLGAGVQSTVLFLLALGPDPKLRFDVAVFADTGEEPSAVYAGGAERSSFSLHKAWRSMPFSGRPTPETGLATGGRHESRLSVGVWLIVIAPTGW